MYRSVYVAILHFFFHACSLVPFSSLLCVLHHFCFRPKRTDKEADGNNDWKNLCAHIESRRDNIKNVACVCCWLPVFLWPVAHAHAKICINQTFYGVMLWAKGGEKNEEKILKKWMSLNKGEVERVRKKNVKLTMTAIWSRRWCVKKWRNSKGIFFWKGKKDSYVPSSSSFCCFCLLVTCLSSAHTYTIYL